MRIVPDLASALALLAGLSSPAIALAQAPPDPAALLSAQREAMTRLSFLDGVWRGPAWALTPQGRHEVVQTERIGPFLGGSVRVIEGLGYAADRSIAFNSLGVISWDPLTSSYAMTAWAMGRQGTFPLRVTEDGFSWESPAGPGAIIRYTATVRDGVFHEVGERIAGQAPPMQMFEMTLRRIGDTSWPAADQVPIR